MSNLYLSESRGCKWWLLLDQEMLHTPKGISFCYEDCTQHSHKSFIEEELKEEPGCVCIVLKSKLDDVLLKTIGYKHNKMCSVFCHELKCRWYNWMCVVPDEVPQLNLGTFKFLFLLQYPCNFKAAIVVCIDVWKKWVTTNPYFQLHTSLIGINAMKTCQPEGIHFIIGRTQLMYADDNDEWKMWLLFSGLVVFLSNNWYWKLNKVWMRDRGNC